MRGRWVIGDIREIVQKPQRELVYLELVNPLEMAHMNTIFNILSMLLSNINRIRWFPH
jgi:hypothetical protein